MRLQTSRNFLNAMAAIILILGIASCKKIMDVKPETQVDQSQAYRNVYDADAAIIGNVALSVLRHIKVHADQNALAA